MSPRTTSSLFILKLPPREARMYTRKILPPADPPFRLNFPRRLDNRSFVNDALQRSLAILAWMVLPVIAGFVLWRAWLSRLQDGHALAGRLARASSQTSIVGLIPPM